MLKEFSLLCIQKKALQKYLHAKIDTKWVCVKKRNMAKIAQNYTNTRNSQYTQQSLFCNKIGIKIKETCVILIVVNHIKPLLISTGFLKYPLELKKNQLELKKKFSYKLTEIFFSAHWNFFSVQDLELRKNFSEHWKKISVSL